MEEQIATGPVGLGGWLTLRIVQLLLISPMWMMILLFRDASASWLYVSLAVVALGVICGVLMLLRSSFAVTLSGTHLGVLTVYALFIGYNDIHSKAIRHLGLVLTIVVLDIAMYFAWFLYFRLSERVRNTFGRNL